MLVLAVGWERLDSGQDQTVLTNNPESNISEA